MFKEGDEGFLLPGKGAPSTYFLSPCLTEGRSDSFVAGLDTEQFLFSSAANSFVKNSMIWTAKEESLSFRYPQAVVLEVTFSSNLEEGKP